MMIQHVENLKRTYTREHAELEELKEALLQSEKSFSSLGERGNDGLDVGGPYGGSCLLFCFAVIVA